MAVTLTEKIWKKERAKVEKCPSAPEGCEKKKIPVQGWELGEF